MKLPPLPAAVYSVLGAVKVSYMSLKKAKKDNICGQYRYVRRSIRIAPGMGPEAEWATLWHEIVHVALMDAGARRNVLTEEQEEVVCDVVGTHLTAMMLNGSLTVTSLGTRKATT